ncbi:MAG: transcriptional repressor LexA [Bacillota bacterium]|nr:transcriptional repressor LexA [Bacillota bacterium]
MVNSKANSKEMDIYEFIRHEVLAKGYPPSVREICARVGLSSTSTVHGYLTRMEKKGLIRRDPTKPRAIELIKDPVVNKELIDIPIVGRVQAGMPILAVENIEDSFSIPLNYLKSKKDVFMLKVSGESMIEAGIHDGDLVIIEKVKTASNGEIVVALIENEVTIKRFFKEKDFIRLQPENSTMEPIIVNDCTIVGKLIGLYRSY